MVKEWIHPSDIDVWALLNWRVAMVVICHFPQMRYAIAYVR